MESTPRTAWLLAVALFLATLSLYRPTLNNGFVHFDDFAYIVQNDNVTTGLTLENVRWAFTTFEQGNWHPVTWMAHQAVAQAFGLNPAGHHLASIALHAANVAILFLLLAFGAAPSLDARHLARSMFVAALFAFHPINVESVSWASELKSLLCMFFSLLATAAYGRYAHRPSIARYMVVAALFALALMSKPMAVTLPVLFLLLDYWPLERLNLAAPFAPDARRLVLEKVPLLLMSFADSWVTIVAQRSGNAFRGLEKVQLPFRLENAVLSLVLYLRRLVWPNDLAVLYPHRGSDISHTHVVLATLVLIALVALLWRFRGHRPLVFGFAFFFVGLLPVLGILQVGFQAMADRYAYLPFIGVFIAVAWEWPSISARIPSAVTAALAGVALVAFAVVTVRTEYYWRDSVTLFSRAHEMAKPSNIFIETSLAAALLEQRRPDEALTHLRIAAEVAPNDFGAHYNVAYLLATRGDRSGAVAELQRALQCPTSPDHVERARDLLRRLQQEPGRQ